MIKQRGLAAMPRNMQAAPWAALGSFLPQQDVFAPLREHVQLACKTVSHTPPEQWLDRVVSMLADGASRTPINTRRRPDPALAAAWGRARFADQATRPRVLEALTPSAVAQLRTAVEQRYRRAGQVLPPLLAHAPLVFDIDLTGLPAGRHAEGSTKGDFSGEQPAGGAHAPGSAPRRTMTVWYRWSRPAISPRRPGCAPRSPRQSR
jgi:hypothetical protein